MLPFIAQALLFVKNNRVLILVAAFIALFLFNLKQCSDNKSLKQELAIVDHNLAAATDTIRVTKDRQGNDEYNKLSFLVTEVENLKKANAELYKEVKETKGKVNQISKIGVQIVHDTVPLLVDGKLIDSTVTAKFSFDTTYSPGNFRSISGFTQYDLKTKVTTGSLTKDRIGIKFVTGIKGIKENKPEIFVRSTYPGFEVTELEGAVLDKDLFKKKKIPLLTLGIGVGWNPATYDFSSKKFDFSATRIGATIGLNINVGKLFTK